MIQSKVSNYIINKITEDNIAYQAVLCKFPFNYTSIQKILLSAWSIFRSGETSFYPLFLGLESTARCNLKCNFCPRTDFLTRNVGNMDFNLYCKIIDSIRPVFITLSQLGEPLLHPQIGEMIRYASLKKCIVRITTNATLLDKEHSRMIIETGLDHILISFDSCSKASYEKLRLGAKFDQVVSNIKVLIDIKAEQKSVKPAISFNVTLNKDNIHEIKDLIDFCLAEFGIAPTFTLIYSHGKETFINKTIDKTLINFVKEGCEYAKQLKIISLYQNLSAIYSRVIFGNTFYRQPCFFPYYTTNVSWDGKVYPCCMFFDCQMVMGDLGRESFMDIWNGEEYRHFRRFLRISRNKIPLCSTCPLSDYNINNSICKVLRYAPFLKPISKRCFVKIENEKYEKIK